MYRSVRRTFPIHKRVTGQVKAFSKKTTEITAPTIHDAPRDKAQTYETAQTVPTSKTSTEDAQQVAQPPEQQQRPLPAQPPPAAPPSGPKSLLQVSKQTNGLRVVTLETGLPVVHLAFCYRAGSKYETEENRGVTHALRNTLGIVGSSTATASNLVRRVQNMGGSVACTAGREHIKYTLECMESHLTEGLYCLGELTTAPVFTHDHLETCIDTHQEDLDKLRLNQTAHVLETVHKAAYRIRGLGNSLFMPENRVGAHTPEILDEFCRESLDPSNMCVVGVGVSHDQLLRELEKLDLTTSPDECPRKHVPGTFFGGDIRMDNLNNNVHVAMVNEGVGLTSRDFVTARLLQYLMGTGQLIKHAPHVSTSRIGQAVARVARYPAAASCVNYNYEESGLFGYHVIAHAAEVAPVLQAVVRAYYEVGKGAIPEVDLNTAKTRLKTALLREYEKQESVANMMGRQALVADDIIMAKDMMAKVDAVNACDVSNLAGCLFGGKRAMVAMGDLSCTPYVDELFV